MNIIQSPSIVYPQRIILSEVNEYNVDKFCPTLHPMELLQKYPMKKAIIAKFLGISSKAIDNYLYGTRPNPILPVQRLAAELSQKWSIQAQEGVKTTH
ncbi:MAG: hypothetical protein F6K24_41605 [Okeania sp. SIO2D1]|nr:hypothetical protein [Okeania sp. SIO2D1]